MNWRGCRRVRVGDAEQARRGEEVGRAKEFSDQPKFQPSSPRQCGRPFKLASIHDTTFAEYINRTQ